MSSSERHCPLPASFPPVNTIECRFFWSFGLNRDFALQLEELTSSVSADCQGRPFLICPPVDRQKASPSDEASPQPMYLDDLPVWGFIGKVEKRESSKDERYFLFTHFHYDLSYNKNNVIEVGG
eukprot:1143089-Pelagomonas_calceolata.AAC.5